MKKAALMESMAQANPFPNLVAIAVVRMAVLGVGIFWLAASPLLGQPTSDSERVVLPKNTPPKLREEFAPSRDPKPMALGSYRGFGEVWLFADGKAALANAAAESGECDVEVTDEGIVFQTELFAWRKKWSTAALAFGDYQEGVLVIKGQSGPVWVMILAILDAQGDATRVVRLCVAKNQ